MVDEGPRPAEGGRAAAGRAAWTFVTQGLSSTSNFLLSAFVLAAVPARSFAVFAVCLTTYLLFVQFARNVVGIPVLVLYADDRDDGGVGRAVAVACLSGMVAAIALVITAALWREAAGQLLVLAVAMPFLLAQDALRHVAIARGRPQLAAGGDGLWIGLQVAASAALFATGTAGATSLLAAWAGAGACSAAGLATWSRLLGPLFAPGLTRARQWLECHAGLCRRLALEFVVTSGSYYALSYGLVAVSGSEQLGYLRAAQTVFGPASVLLLGGAVVGIPESVRLRHDLRRLLRLALLISAGLTVLSLACGLAVYALLPAFGPDLFPDSWSAVRDVIPWLTLFGASIGAAAGAIAGLRALDAGRWILQGRGIAGAMALAVGLLATVRFGARGALFGLALGEGVLAVRAWSEVVRRVSAAEPAPQ